MTDVQQNTQFPAVLFNQLSEEEKLEFQASSEALSLERLNLRRLERLAQERLDAASKAIIMARRALAAQTPQE